MFLTADFGPSYAGLSTVGYAQHQADGTAVVARTTTGVVAIGNGCYGVSVTPNALTVSVKWDTGGASPIYAHEAIDQSIAEIKAQADNIQKLGTNRFVTDPATGIATLYDDDGTTPLQQWEMYEDAAGTIAYRGKGAELRIPI